MSTLGSSEFYIYDNPATAARLTINSSGSVLIPTQLVIGSNPGGTVFGATSSGNTRFVTTSGSSGQIAFVLEGTTSNSAALIGESTNSGSYCYMGEGSNFNGSSSGYSISCSGPTAGISDARLKKDILPLPAVDGLDAIMQIQPVHYLWKDERMNKAHPNGEIGFIAQNVERVLPDLVGEAPQLRDAPIKLPGGVSKALEYERLVAPAVLAIQQLKHSFDSDHEAVNQLKADNDKLRAQLKAVNDNFKVQNNELRLEVDELRLQVHAR